LVSGTALGMYGCMNGLPAMCGVELLSRRATEVTCGIRGLDLASALPQAVPVDECMDHARETGLELDAAGGHAVP
jgi:hypothetical protein